MLTFIELQDAASRMLQNTYWKNPISEQISKFIELDNTTRDLNFGEPYTHLWANAITMCNWFTNSNINTQNQISLGTVYNLPESHLMIQNWSSQYFGPSTYIHSRQAVGITAIGIASTLSGILNNNLVLTIPASPALPSCPAIPEITRLSHNENWLYDMVGTIYGGLDNVNSGFVDTFLALQQLTQYATTEWNNLNTAITNVFNSNGNEPSLPTSQSNVPSNWTYSLTADTLMQQRINNIVTLYQLLMVKSATLVNNSDVGRNPLTIILNHSNIIKNQIAREKVWWADDPNNLNGPWFRTFYVTNSILSAYSNPSLIDMAGGIFDKIRN